jgi:hypothetical protein
MSTRMLRESGRYSAISGGSAPDFHAAAKAATEPCSIPVVGWSKPLPVLELVSELELISVPPIGLGTDAEESASVG